ncbi:hypothetical protein SBRY_60241 [Actinacidiphila bryophytorum]|uniref:Uncharacterized protein n=1 Tax=Actinacidiphila bryophytorum TaxID=1436133 RepID=A0A9W4H660_9ACTN|nr:hypothetical protein SBRY_60241 [Actinacidiphila bryophytorum]
MGAQFPAPLMVALSRRGRRFQAAPSAQEGERFSGTRGTARPAHHRGEGERPPQGAGPEGARGTARQAPTGGKDAAPPQVAITGGPRRGKAIAHRKGQSPAQQDPARVKNLAGRLRW